MSVQSEKFKWYSSNAGLTVETGTNASESLQTVNVELAPRGEDGEMQWKEKICIQPNQAELVELALLLLDKRERLEWQYHGKGHNKSLKVARQANGVYMAASEGKDKRAALRVPHENAYFMAILVMRQLARNHGGLTLSDAISVLVRVAGTTAVVAGHAEGGGGGTVHALQNRGR